MPTGLSARMSPLHAALIVVAALSAIAVSLAVGLTRSDGAGPRSTLGHAPLLSEPVYPQQYRVSPAQVDQRASFTVYHPNNASANDSMMSAAYVLPLKGKNGAVVEMQYPLPDAAAQGVRLHTLNVTEEPWPYGDPDQFFDEDVATSPDAGKSRCDFNNVPAVCVEANSPSDATQENAAYMRLDYNGISIELWGGNNLQRLIGIAHALTRGGSSP